jgi:hypothetical protein
MMAAGTIVALRSPQRQQEALLRKADILPASAMHSLA